ncbi:unnamed protein product [Brassicogethes aeneus]|uniref:Lipase domain-containing protein n=1 Tax=Brassicogethes aeneus TaxID=1431903 RepID=A0A9P0B6G8_BRAAE|nr:unnamed protein product [Brassicogethes aeneus]
MNETNTSGVLIQTMFYLMNQSIIQEQAASYNYYLLQIGQAPQVTEKCYGTYGCFNLSSPWTSQNRPVSLYPEDLIKIEPRYPVYTKKRMHDPHYIDLNDIFFVESSGIDPMQNIYFISHGYLEGGDNPWIVEMAHELIKQDPKCSVIAVDWRGGSGPPYTQAVANIRLVGVITAHLIAEIARHTKHLKLDQVHLIGHSLGAHLSGYAGYTLQKEFNLKLGRISGLDPAEPHFGQEAPPVRLDRSAAKYVDIVHTDANHFIELALGMKRPIGHVDYYPNGGDNQPGCGKSMVQYVNEQEGSFFRGLRKYLGCNHMRSHEYFMASIRPTCSFRSFSCSSFKDFEAGKCLKCGNKNKCLQFGFHGRKSYEKHISQKPNDKESVIQYLITSDARPYCMGHYFIRVKVSSSAESLKHKGEIGQLMFTMHSTQDGKGPHSSPAGFVNGYYGPGDYFQKVIVADEVKDLRAVEVTWKYTSSLFNPLTWRILTNPKIFLDEIIVDSLELQKSLRVCPKNKMPLLNGIPQLMIPSYC